jgi:hypothetical protein
MDKTNNFNLDYWPVVYLKSMNGSSITDESFNDFKKMYLELLVKAKNNNEKIILICNINTTEPIPMKYIMEQAKFNKEIYDSNKKYVKGVCILCKDKNFKNILNLYFTIAKPAAPYKLCRSYEKANKYLNEILNINFKAEIFENNIENESNTDSSDDKENEDI